ncbi:MAG: hypothetical protein WC804_17045 [Sphingomonas sp.]|uniref:hypothetical protein n=1 Tax=Sphingomonas sp. TaxID=28214 RepID=UPI003569ECD0
MFALLNWLTPGGRFRRRANGVARFERQGGRSGFVIFARSPIAPFAGAALSYDRAVGGKRAAGFAINLARVPCGVLRKGLNG